MGIFHSAPSRRLLPRYIARVSHPGDFRFYHSFFRLQSARVPSESKLMVSRYGWRQSTRSISNHLTRLPDCGWFWGFCNYFQRILVCKLLTEKPKEGRNSLPIGNLSQPPNPRPTRPLGSYSSPVAIEFPSYEIQSLQLPGYSFTLFSPASLSAITFGQAVTPEPQ